jgi:hypothetical protein
MTEEKAVLNPQDDISHMLPGESEEEYDRRCDRWQENEVRKRREEAAAAEPEPWRRNYEEMLRRSRAARTMPAADTAKRQDKEREEDEEEEEEEEEGEEKVMQDVAADPIAQEKARREERWAQKNRREEQEDDLRRHWEAVHVAEVEKNGGIATLTRDNPYTADGRWPLPRAARPGDAPRYASPAPSGDDAETQLTAIIAECRYFMRELAFESARMTPHPGDRMGFIDGACRLAESGALVGQTVAHVRGSEAPPVFKPAPRR